MIGVCTLLGTGLVAADDAKLHVEGYGEIIYSYLDFSADQKSSPTGSRPDSRATIDVSRLALKIESEIIPGFEVEAEVEIEHGGTGSAVEVEYEEFGEFESKVEKGGEVVLEELHITRAFFDALQVRVGHFYVAVGLTQRFNYPTEFFTARRPESESEIIPTIWHETGVELRGKWNRFRYQAQLVNGLDATGFDSKNWIVGGHQQRFEEVRATNMAFVGRVDVALAEGVEIGVSAYTGDSADNRPKPDLEDFNARVSIVDSHASVRWNRLRGQGMLLYGRLQNAAIVSERNRTLSNALNVPRTPVAKSVYALHLELGYDLMPWIHEGEDQMFLFASYDDFDSMATVPSGAFDVPRFKRRVYAGGLNYIAGNKVVVKMEYSARRLGASGLNPENTANLSVGFRL